MWTAEFKVEFTPLPPELEEAYWETMHYFASILRQHMLEELTVPAAELETVSQDEGVASFLP